MQRTAIHMAGEEPYLCPSYTESSIVDQQVPFIIFIFQQSKFEDGLSAAADKLELTFESCGTAQMPNNPFYALLRTGRLTAGNSCKPRLADGQ